MKKTELNKVEAINSEDYFLDTISFLPQFDTVLRKELLLEFSKDKFGIHIKFSNGQKFLLIVIEE